MKNNIKLNITVPGQTRYLSLIGHIGENLARAVCACDAERESLAQKLNIVLTEAMVNTIKHANIGNPEKDIQINISISDNELIIRIYDCGKGFNIQDVGMPGIDADILSERGRGIYIIKSLMDSVVYIRKQHCNYLEMRGTLNKS